MKSSLFYYFEGCLVHRNSVAEVGSTIEGFSTISEYTILRFDGNCKQSTISINKAKKPVNHWISQLYCKSSIWFSCQKAFVSEWWLHLVIDIVNEDGKEFAPMTHQKKNLCWKGTSPWKKEKSWRWFDIRYSSWVWRTQASQISLSPLTIMKYK